MNFLLVLAMVAALSGLSLGERKRPGYCYKEFPPTGEPDMVEVKKMNQLIEILRRDALKKFDDFKEEIQNLKKRVNQEKNGKSILEKEISELKKRVNEEKNGKSILEKQISELKKRVNEEKNGKSKLEKQISELKKRIQECDVELDEDGTKDILDATRKGSFKGVKYWYCKDPTSIHANNGKDSNWTLLHIASDKGHLDILEFLLSKGVDLEAEESDTNWTPLMFASMRGHVTLVKALLDKGANVNHQNTDKQTPLHYAVFHNYLPIVKLLVEKGADRSLRNHHDRTPLDLARKIRSKSIVDYLSSL